MFQQQNGLNEEEEPEVGIISPHTTKPRNSKDRKSESLAVKKKTNVYMHRNKSFQPSS